jgi:hypothetical protein
MAVTLPNISRSPARSASAGLAQAGAIPVDSACLLNNGLWGWRHLAGQSPTANRPENDFGASTPSMTPLSISLAKG